MRSDSQQEMLQGAALAIAELGAGRPLALFVDDAHLLDGASAALLGVDLATLGASVDEQFAIHK